MQVPVFRVTWTIWVKRKIKYDFAVYLCIKQINMDRKIYYSNSPDADVEAPPSYETTTTQLNTNFRSEQSASSSSAYEPSAPPSEVSYSYQQLLNVQQPTNYQTMPVRQQPLYVMRYIIKSKNGNDRHFPVNAAIFVLGL